MREFRDARESAGLSQEEVARRLGKAQSYVSKSQIGERRIDVIELFHYCCAVEISFADFTRNLEQSLQQMKRQKAKRTKPSKE